MIDVFYFQERSERVKQRVNHHSSTIELLLDAYCTVPHRAPIEFEGALYMPVMARGSRWVPIVVDDLDRSRFVRTLSEACGRAGWEVYAWGLMDDHYHLAPRTPAANLVEDMK